MILSSNQKLYQHLQDKGQNNKSHFNNFAVTSFHIHFHVEANFANFTFHGFLWGYKIRVATGITSICLLHIECYASCKIHFIRIKNTTFEANWFTRLRFLPTVSPRFESLVCMVTGTRNVKNIPLNTLKLFYLNNIFPLNTMLSKSTFYGQLAITDQ